ncbi:recombinase family protein [Hymenobacter fodinae]|uniref:Recombinase family protein n=1 Tax=Hymenobacter fodinae TaxID=2510796 RepID=A0A4Z0P371_9BACT|nr:recombinase family protein [Hymenobacter fodinae]TGE06094.1 recombinase family protein [Hymenobacter fodinae]
MTKTYVTYIRVSTAKQGASGLGMEAQRTIVNTFIDSTSAIIREYVEVESGKNNNRPILAQAIADCKRNGYTLLIAKLDRLSRSVSFLFNLMDTKVDFVAADLPTANTLTIGIFATIAQYERELTSSRTRAALQAKRARGEELGNATNFTDETRALGRAAMQLNARMAEANVKATYIIDLILQNPQRHTLRDIAAVLNAQGYRTRRGKKFTSVQVLRLAKTSGKTA